MVQWTVADGRCAPAVTKGEWKAVRGWAVSANDVDKAYGRLNLSSHIPRTMVVFTLLVH